MTVLEEMATRNVEVLSFGQPSNEEYEVTLIRILADFGRELLERAAQEAERSIGESRYGLTIAARIRGLGEEK